MMEDPETQGIAEEEAAAIHEAERDWGGLTIRDEQETWYVGPLPGRKQVALYVVEKGRLRVAAYFPSEDLAEQFAKWMFRVTEPILGRDQK